MYASKKRVFAARAAYTTPPPPSPHTISCEPRDILFAGYVLVMAINVFMTLWTMAKNV